MKSYKNLLVWQKGMDLVLAIYAVTRKFPKEEIYGLTSQMRRAAVSVPSNIAEGCSRKSQQEYIHFLTIAFGSGAELETQLEIAEKLQFVSDKDTKIANDTLVEVMKMLNRLITSLNTKS